MEVGGRLLGKKGSTGIGGGEEMAMGVMKIIVTD